MREGRVELLVILDGASEPPRVGAPTSLERAATPALDALCAEGELCRLRTVAPWLEAGSEHAIPALLGWTPPAPVDRGAVEAAARGIVVGEGERAWRIDVRSAADGTRARAIDALPSLSAALPSHRLHALGGHRLLAVGPEPLPALPAAPPASPAPALPGLASVPAASQGLPASSPLPGLASLPAASRPGSPGLPALPPLDRFVLVRWSAGIAPPRLLDASTVMVAAPGAAAGLARLLGAEVVTPAGATGRPGSDLAAKATAALSALRDGAERIVVHVGGPDEAAHELDAAAKVAAIEAADRDLIAPLAAELRARGAGTLRVCPDHGCDPADGRHDAAPVPCVTWSAQVAPRSALDAPRAATAAPRSAPAAPRSARDAPRAATAAPRLTERAVAELPAVTPHVAFGVEERAA